MNKSCLIEDFTFVVNTIKSFHPLAIYGMPVDFEEYISRLEYKIKDKDSLLISLCKLTALLQDGHTNIETEYSLDDLCINLPCIWLYDGLFATSDYYGILKGDKITGIANITMNEVLDKLCKIIPHENDYLVRMRATMYPFINYHIFSEFILRNLNALNYNTVKITVMRDNQPLTLYLSLEKYNGFLAFKSNEKFIDFWIDNEVAILKLDECKYNYEYIEKLNNFFDLVKESNIQNVIIDLRDNMGGSCSVIREFLKHIDIESYYFYGVKVRNQNENNLMEINSEKCPVINSTDGNTELFKGKVICLVSNKTFSSARTFATVLKDNNIAIIAGEPTGGKPCSFGNPIRFETPNFKIKFRVSSRIFKRPAHNCQDDIALFPDVPIYPTIDDLIHKNDVVLNKSITLCNSI